MIGPINGFVGGVVADEPRAALAGRALLAQGGTAADAAATAFFAMTVTLPTRASQGGGGMCLVYDPRLNRTETVNFAAAIPADGGPIAVPAVARGLAVLQGRYGRLKWEQVVAPAEGLARFGFPVSRALAVDLAAAGTAATADTALELIFRRTDGTPLREGDQLIQSALADTLGDLRARGAPEWFSGQPARDFVAVARAQGATFTDAELIQLTPEFRAAATVPYESYRVAFAPPPVAGGLTSAQIWQMAAPGWRRAAPEDRYHLLAEASVRAAWDRQRWLGPNLEAIEGLGLIVQPARIQSLMATYAPDRHTPAASYAPPVRAPLGGGWDASVVAVDREGGAAACVTGLGGPFGVGRMARGVILAPSPTTPERGLAGASAVIVTRQNAGQLVLVAGASGGLAGNAALAQVALALLIEERQLDDAITRLRVVPRIEPDVLAIEEPGTQIHGGLARRGWALESSPPLGRVNAVSCPGGLTAAPERCQLRSDRRGHGLASGGLE